MKNCCECPMMECEEVQCNMESETFRNGQKDKELALAYASCFCQGSLTYFNKNCFTFSIQ